MANGEWLVICQHTSPFAIRHSLRRFMVTGQTHLAAGAGLPGLP